MSESVKMPALGESVTEGTVSSWLKAVGDTVEADEPLLEVATDKVDTEVPSPASGVLLEIRVPEDETVEVGTVEAATVERLRALEHVLSVELSGGELVCTCEASPHNLVDILDTLRVADVALGRVWSEPPTLNDVFLEITGRELRD